MTDATTQPRKRRGPPRRTGSGLSIGVRLRPRILAALDEAVIAQKTATTRAGLIRNVLAQWLRDVNLLPAAPPRKL